MLLDLLSKRMQLPAAYLRKTAGQASHLYKEYFIPKRDGIGVRTIHHPARQLKAIQRELVATVLANLPVHAAAMAYRPKRNIRANAAIHATNHYLMRLDITDFFPTLRREHIQQYIVRNAAMFSDWSDDDIKFVCDISCRHGKLTIGAPTSPPWCNALCFYLDSVIVDYTAIKTIRYSRYADDLYFSSHEPAVLWHAQSDLISLIETIDLPSGLKVNKAKTAHSSRKRRRQVTGLVLTNEGSVSLGRTRKRKVRSLIHKLDSLSPDQRDSLAGFLGFCADVEPQFVNRLVTKYGHELVGRAMNRRK